MRGEIVLTRRSLLGVVICVWLVGGFTTLGATYFYVQSKSNELAYAINRPACGLKTLTLAPLARAEAISRDESASPADRAAARLTIKNTNAFLALYGTVPRHFDCTKLQAP